MNQNPIPEASRRPPPIPSDGKSKESVATPPDNLNPLAGLLKAPAWTIQQIESDRNLWPWIIQLLGWGLIFHALYGLAMALFGGWGVACITIIKVPLIALCSLALCLPSFYILLCVGGMQITLVQALTLASGVLAMTGLMLLGLAPVAWLFSVSTTSVGFVTILNLVLWFIALMIARRFLSFLQGSKKMGYTSGISWWIVIYLIVSLQMATTMRPLLTKPVTGDWWSAEKKAFIVHFFDTLEGKK